MLGTGAPSLDPVNRFGVVLKEQWNHSDLVLRALTRRVKASRRTAKDESVPLGPSFETLGLSAAFLRMRPQTFTTSQDEASKTADYRV
jgi:hypothetical protein